MVHDATPVYAAPALPRAYILVYSLGSGGVTHAVCDQAAMFSDLGYRTRILTLALADNHAAAELRLRSTGRLRPDVETRNIHSEYRSHATGQLVTVPAWVAEPHHSGLRVAEGANGTRNYYDRSATLVARVKGKAGADGRAGLVEISYFAPEGCVATERYSRDGSITYCAEKVQGEAYLEHFVGGDGVPYATRAINPATGRGQGVVARSAPDQPTHVVEGGIPGWHVEWLQAIVDAEPTRPIVVAEAPSWIPKLARLRAESAARLAVLHNNHLDEPWQMPAPTRRDHKFLEDSETMAAIDTLIVLTEAQREDLVAIGVDASMIRVIPNSTHLTSDLERDPEEDLVVMVTRLNSLKAIDEAIRAFSLVHQEIPTARLEIFGSGPERSRLRGMIDELGLSQVARLPGRTNAPMSELGRAQLTMFTSTREAMPLAILEANAMAVPVVAYHCSYASELIEHGRTGYVVPELGQFSAQRLAS